MKSETKIKKMSKNCQAKSKSKRKQSSHRINKITDRVGHCQIEAVCTFRKVRIKGTRSRIETPCIRRMMNDSFIGRRRRRKRVMDMRKGGRYRRKRTRRKNRMRSTGGGTRQRIVRSSGRRTEIRSQ